MSLESQIPLKAIRARQESIRAEMKAAADDPTRWAFLEAAAVLARFEPRTLRPVGDPLKSAADWTDLAADSEPVAHRGQGDWWRLRPEIRRQALRRLGTRERIRTALAANPERPDDPVQRMFEAIIDRRPLAIERLPRGDLAGLATARDWLDGILEKGNLPDADAIQRALPLADLLAPMRRLAARSFVGRQRELQSLRDYVGVRPAENFGRAAWRFVRQLVYDLTSRPPLMIYGPGGVGKSTLIARFILDHVEGPGQDALPFVYLDIDRPAVDPERPMSLLLETTGQLATQLPRLQQDFAAFREDLYEEARQLDDFESAKSFPHVLGEQSVQRFGALVGRVESPVLLVVDTFEEAQFLGPDVVHNFWSLLVALQRAAPNLCIVVAGRAKVEDFPTEPLELGELAPSEALELLRQYLDGAGRRGDTAILKEIVDIVGRNPMSLQLAADVVRNQGIDKLRNVETRTWLMLRVKAEAVQARLYGRILSHIHHPEVKKLAYPGLIVRRIDADVVREVLAEPCGLALEDAGAAQRLINELGREVSLVERDPVDGALRHRQYVRRLMLADLTSEVSEAVVRTIHDRAVAFYDQLERTLRQEDETPPSRDQASYRATKAIVTRAEEIYHRLKRGDAPAEVAKRWQPGVEPYLRNALEELEPQARLWLSERLGVTPDERLLAQADLERWEEITARAVQRHLQSGDAQGALRRLRERRERSPASPLFRLELEALRMLGRKREALAAADKAVKSARRGGDAAVVRELLLQASLIEESRDQLEAALARVEEARQVPGAPPEPEEGLRLLITRIRLLRKLGEARDPERRVAIDQAQQLLTPELVRSLHGRPALFREVVAELGVVMPNVLEQGIAALGLDLRVQGQIDALARGVTDWNSRLAASRGSGPGELAERAGVDANTPQTWKEYLGQLGRRQLSHTILNWHAELPADRGIDKTLVDFYRAAVDIGIHQSQPERG